MIIILYNKPVLTLVLIAMKFLVKKNGNKFAITFVTK